MRILLLGASGFVGGVLAGRLARRHDVVGTCSPRRGTPHRPIDIVDHEALGALARDGFDVVVNAVALTAYRACELDPAFAYAVNVAPVQTLVAVLRTSTTRLVQLSSDNVFSGEHGDYFESSPPRPVNRYGECKLQAETVALQEPRHTVIRLPMMYGRSPWADRFLARFAREETPAQTDVWCAPVFLDALADDLEYLWSLGGVVHYGGAERLSRFELMHQVAQGLQLPTRVVPVREADMPDPGARRPRDVVLRSERHDRVSCSVERALARMRRERG